MRKLPRGELLDTARSRIEAPSSTVAVGSPLLYPPSSAATYSESQPESETVDLAECLRDTRRWSLEVASPLLEGLPSMTESQQRPPEELRVAVDAEASSVRPRTDAAGGCAAAMSELEARISRATRAVEYLLEEQRRLLGREALVQQQFLGRSPGIRALGPRPKLNIGPGAKWKRRGWLTLDFYFAADITLDLRECPTLPFEDASLGVVFCSHFIEHIDDCAAAHLFAELARCMAKGGLFRVNTPSYERARIAYELGAQEFFRAGGVRCVGESLEDLLLNYFASYRLGSYSGGPRLDASEVTRRFRSSSPEEFTAWCVAQIPAEAAYRAHINGYTYQKLERMLLAAGFRFVAPSSYRQSFLPELRSPAFDNRPHVSLFVEALR